MNQTNHAELKAAAKPKPPYETGKQPCGDYKPQIDMHHTRNEHQCYRCGGRVSFCENCYRDHHHGGYESCNALRKDGGE